MSVLIFCRKTVVGRRGEGTDELFVANAASLTHLMSAKYAPIDRKEKKKREGQGFREPL